MVVRNIGAADQGVLENKIKPGVGPIASEARVHKGGSGGLSPQKNFLLLDAQISIYTLQLLLSPREKKFSDFSGIKNVIGIPRLKYNNFGLGHVK